MIGLSFTIAFGPRQRSHSQVRVTRDLWPHFTVSDSRLPQLRGQVPVFISAIKRVSQLYPRALGSLSFAFYDSQGYDGGIRSRLHTGVWNLFREYSYSYTERWTLCRPVEECIEWDKYISEELLSSQNTSYNVYKYFIKYVDMSSSERYLVIRNQESRVSSEY
jgi:hypothetical protein